MENQGVTKEFPTEIKPSSLRVEEAAKWLVANRHSCENRLIPTLKERFGLCNLEAIEAAKAARYAEEAR